MYRTMFKNLAIHTTLIVVPWLVLIGVVYIILQVT